MACLDRMTSQHGALLIVDVQEKLVPLVQHADLVRANCVRLAKAAELLQIPLWATEQYPKGLGPLVPELVERIPHRSAKTTFHCAAIPELVEQIHGRRIQHIALAGIETHVCILQTALELMKLGLHVQIPADAVSSRFVIDWEFALRRLELAGAIVTTTETVLFEWIETSDHPQFKAFSDLVKNFNPSRNTNPS